MKLHIYKYCGLLAVIIEDAAIVYFVLASHQPLSLAHTISDYGSLSSTWLVFSIIYTLAAALFGLFGMWLKSELSLHHNVIITLLVAAIAQTSLAWIPNKGSLWSLHYTAAIIVMISMPTLVYYFTLANKSPLVRLLSKIIIWIEILAIVLLPIAVHLRVPLIAELIAGIGFQIWVVLATFDRTPLMKKRV